MFEVKYLTDRQGQPKAVAIPIELSKRLLPGEPLSVQPLSEGIEDYCLNKAMDEARDTLLLSREEALKYLEE